MTTIPGRLGRGLNLLGIVLVGYAVLGSTAHTTPVARIVTCLALAAWLLVLFLPDRWRLVPLVVMVVAGGLATVPTQGVAIAPVLVAAIRSLGTPTIRLREGLVLTTLGVALVPVGLLYAVLPPLALASIEAGLLIAAVGGFSRRQSRAAEVRERELLRQQARGAALAERQAVARDIHDVLAHSLGGLVLQLDAIDAQLEAGQVTDAAARVRSARSLAAAGLGEARRAVDALRDDRREPIEGTALVASLEELAGAHRALGGVIDFGVAGRPRAIDGTAAEALRRAFQESLTNARKHAPGAVVTARLSWATAIELEVSNAVVNTEPGDGHGLAGMAERFDGVGSVTAAAIGDRFVVSARVDS